MKNNKFLMVVSILLLFVMLAGATFSYFSVSVSNDNVTAQAATFGGGVEVTGIYTGHGLIPLSDSDVSVAINDTNKCVDIHGYNACHLYSIVVSNTGDRASYTGTIRFNLVGIENLKYTILDENNAEYVEKTLIISGTDQTLGDTFTLEKNESKEFKIIIWLSNVERNQDSEDSGGSFDGIVTYVSTYGNRITGTFSGL